MNCRTFAILAGFLAAGLVGPGHALAFEQQQAPMAVQPPVAEPAPAPAVTIAPGALNLETKTGPSSGEKPKKSLKLPGVGALTVPKLNFGLDLMYGQAEDDSTSLKFTNDPLVGDDDLTIMGKVKKRF